MTESILDRFKEQYEQDKLNENYDLPDDSLPMGEDDINAYKDALKAIRNDENDMGQIYNKFHQEFRKVHEQELKTSVFNPIVAIKRAYCPDCGAEIISEMPVMINPYTLERIGRYDCKCGARLNLDYSYPRVIYMDENMKEIKVWSD